jgi:hypothetical protein
LGPPVSYIDIDQTVREGNHAPYDFLTMFSDDSITVWLFILLYLYHRCCGTIERPGSAVARTAGGVAVAGRQVS